MSDVAPKKVFISFDGPFVGFTTHKDELSDDTPYIRADLVDELVTALKTAHCWTSKKIHEQYTAPLIEGALSKLEDDLENKE